MEKVAFIIDGGYFTKVYKKIYKKFPTANDVDSYVGETYSYITSNLVKVPSEVYRIFYYDCRPLSTKLINPVDNSSLDLGKSEVFKSNQKLQSDLVRKNFFALRYGELKLPPKQWEQWNVNTRKLAGLMKRKLEATDLIPSINQKGVDMKMGLDIASITSKKLCTKLVLISGDTDMIPAMKTARKEGVQVFLHTFNNLSNFDMAAHADAILSHKKIFPKKTKVLKSS